MWSKTNHEIPKLEFENRIERVRSFAIKHNLSGLVIYSAPKIHQWNQTGHVGYLTNWSNLDRIVDANRMDTDARLTELTSHGHGCWSMFAAKIITSD